MKLYFVCTLIALSYVSTAPVPQYGSMMQLDNIFNIFESHFGGYESSDNAVVKELIPPSSRQSQSLHQPQTLAQMEAYDASRHFGIS